MIGYLEGTLQEVTERTLILNVQGVGYELAVSARVKQGKRKGAAIALFVHTHLRENAMELYGFASLFEREIFLALITVSGVGPKTALGILSLASAQDIQKSVRSADTGMLTKVSGIGKKTAERIIVELKEKFGGKELAQSLTPERTDAFEALIGLGYRAQEAREALAKVPDEVADTTEQIREALRQLA
ncbi:MAG: Holliday junction branch migration protein RuvA [Patescibacteria group bacterium]|jgi:Holliday junction DNA helicase RuvA